MNSLEGNHVWLVLFHLRLAQLVNLFGGLAKQLLHSSVFGGVASDALH